ncbi:uncharacterized protein [Miscanthus floridulus]|uniref:uncharacterized protein n=1 Tax=Miscanthus floridulus TaxID=154761 RepID=UPI003459C03C
MAWTNGVDDMDERPRQARWGRCLGPAPGGRGTAGRVVAGRRAAGASRNRWSEADQGGAGRCRSRARPGWGEGGQGVSALGVAGAPRIRWPAGDRGGEGWRLGGARPSRQRVSAGFTGRVGDGAARGGRGWGGARWVGRARGKLAAANGSGRGGVRA